MTTFIGIFQTLYRWSLSSGLNFSRKPFIAQQFDLGPSSNHWRLPLASQTGILGLRPLMFHRHRVLRLINFSLAIACYSFLCHFEVILKMTPPYFHCADSLAFRCSIMFTRYENTWFTLLFTKCKLYLFFFFFLHLIVKCFSCGFFFSAFKWMREREKASTTIAHCECDSFYWVSRHTAESRTNARFLDIKWHNQQMEVTQKDREEYNHSSRNISKWQSTH